MEQELIDLVLSLEEVEEALKHAFVAKDELVKLMLTCAIAQEHLIIVGPPGTAKSGLIKRFSMLSSPRKNTKESNGKIPYFEYLLTRFTEPNEIFGPIDIKGFRKGTGHRRVTAGMLPHAEIVFLDEVFKANSAILNSLLTVLNERVFYNGNELMPVPLIFTIGATNEVPDDPTLAALFDRFLVRIWTDNVEETRFNELFERGWKLEKDRINEGYNQELGHLITTDVLLEMYQTLNEVDMDEIANDYREVIRRIRAEGIELSDRRVIKLLKLIAASAIRRKSLVANTGDFWLLKHIWNKPDQIPYLQSIINPYIEGFEVDKWDRERDLESILLDISSLTQRQKNLRTDTDFSDLLHQANQLRQELKNHSEQDKTQPLLKNIEALVVSTMKFMEKKN